MLSIYVGIPNIAQDSINDSTLEVTSQEVTNPRPDQIYLKLVSIAKSDSAFHPKLDGFVAQLSLEDKEPFIEINIPDAQTNKKFEIKVEHEVKILNEDRFTEYTKTALGTEKFKVKLDGKTKLHQKGLDPIDITYKKTVEMKGASLITQSRMISLTMPKV